MYVQKCNTEMIYDIKIGEITAVCYLVMLATYSPLARFFLTFPMSIFYVMELPLREKSKK